MLYKLKTSKLFDESQRCRDEDDDCPFAVHRMHLCVDSRLLCVAGNSHVILFSFSKSDACVDCPVTIQRTNTLQFISQKMQHTVDRYRRADYTRKKTIKVEYAYNRKITSKLVTI